MSTFKFLPQVQMDQKGFVLFAMNIVLLSAALGLLVATHSARLERDRERELELLCIGDQFMRAIESYAKSIDEAGVQYPRDLQTLILDTRGGQQRRHLRRIYTDPMTGKADWGLIKDATGIVVGVHSLSKKTPIRKTGFANKLDHLRNAKTYDQWQFRVIGPPPSTAATPAERLTANTELVESRP